MDSPNHSESSDLTRSPICSSESSLGTPIMEAEHKCFPFGAYVGETTDGKQQLLTSVFFPPFEPLYFSPSKYNIGFFASYGLSHEKYTHVVPTPFSLCLSFVPSNRSHSGPSTAKMHFLPLLILVVFWPSLFTMFTRTSTAPSSTFFISSTFAFLCTLFSSNFPTNCSAMAPIPFAGKQFSPRANDRMTKSNNLESVVNSGLKKMPPKNGLKNRSTISSLNPNSDNRSSIVFSLSLCKGFTLKNTVCNLTKPTNTLSSGDPILCSGSRLGKASAVCRNGSATR